MDINGFLNELLQEISKLDFVDVIDFQLEVIILKGRIIMKDRTYFLEVYFNEKTGTMAFALIGNNKRIWGIDFDNIRNWHEHPLENPVTHQFIPEKTITEIIKEFQKIYQRLQVM